MKPDEFETGVANVGFNAVPVTAEPEIVPVVVVNPVRETVIVTFALWPATRFEIVMGNVEPDANPFTADPAEVLTL